MSDTAESEINEEFLTTVLRDMEGRKDEIITIRSYSTENASASGDNYTSSVFRVTLEYRVGDNDDDGELKTQSVIVKVPHRTSELFMKVFAKIYKKEHYIYSDFLPKVYDLLQIDNHFSPRLLHVNAAYTMVFEDLKACDYEMVDKYKMLDFNHCVLSLATLAKFHAASVVLVDKRPDILDNLSSEFLYSQENKQLNEGNIGVISEIFVNSVESWNVFENFRARTERIWDTIVDDMIQLCKPRDNALNVVNHGDTWTNNMFFKYDDSGSPVHITLIDFQVCRYTSPAMDLQYFLITSVGDDVMESRLSDLIDAYLDALNGQLEELGSAQRLKRQELDHELRVAYPYVFTLTYKILPFVFSERENAINFSNYGQPGFNLSTKDIYSISYRSKYYKPMAIRALKFLERKGFF